jgi:transitional endoplasmic reticulum ATPase
MTFFGPQPPQLVTVQTGPKEGQSVQVPYGVFTLPGVENTIETIRTFRDGQPVLVIVGSVRKREATIVKELAELTRQRLAKKSIYRGQAIRLRADSEGDMNLEKPPVFLDTDSIVPEELILNDDELIQVDASLWSPVKHTKACLQHGIPLNRGVLLEGTYGTGKTMTANVTSKVCVDNSWTYILLDDVRALKDALLFAQRYAPAVVFAEDIDRVAADRDQRGNDLLNTIDGVLTKNAQVITVLTTNHVEKLDKAMLRPGRLDAVVTVRPPESKAVGRLIELYSRNLIKAGEDLTEVSDMLAGNIPATIREVTERSKLAMISNGNKNITAEDLKVAAFGMTRHLDLLKAEKPEVSKEEQLGQAFKALLSGKSKETSVLRSEMAQTRRTAAQAARAVTDASDDIQNGLKQSSKQVGGGLKKIKDDTEAILDEIS